MRNKRSKILLAIFILLLVLTTRINRMINANIATEPVPSLKVEDKKSQDTGVPTASFSNNNVAENPLIPDDPAKYGILVQKEENRPRNQSQWDQHMKRSLVQSKALDSMEEKDSFDRIKITPQEFQKRVQMLNNRIKDNEKIVQDNPSDEDAQEKLQTLYMLKSTLTVMEKKIVQKK